MSIQRSGQSQSALELVETAHIFLKKIILCKFSFVFVIALLLFYLALYWFVYIFDIR